MDSTNAAAPGVAPYPKEYEKYFDIAHIKSDLKRKAVRGGAATVSRQFVKQVMGIGVTAIMARLILPQDTGLVGMVTVLTGVIALFSDMGLSAATVQRGEITHQQVSTLFWINLVSGMALGMFTALCAPLIAMFYGDQRLIGITLGVALCFFFSGLAVQHKALMKRQMQFTELAKIDLLSTVVGNVVAITAAFLLPQDQRYWALVLNWIAQFPVEIAACWISCTWRPGRAARTNGLRSLLSFGGNFTVYKFVSYLARNVDNFLIGRAFGPGQLGLYTKAYGLLLLPISQISNPISSIAMPALSRVVDEPARYRQAFRRITSLICILTVPLISWMIVTGDWLVEVWLGPNWMGVAPIFAWLGLSGLVESFGYAIIWLFTSQGRMREQVRWGFISTGIIVGAILLGTPWGTIGIAASYGIIALCIRSPLLFWYVGRSGPVRTRHIYAMLAPYALVSVAVLLVLFIFRQLVVVPNSIVGLLASGAITAVVSLGVLALLPAGREAIREAKNLPALLLQGKK